MTTQAQSTDGAPSDWTPPEFPPDIADPFEGMDEAFSAAPEKEASEFSDLPDGKYQVFVFSAKPFNIDKPGSKRFGYTGINLRFRVLNGPHRGEMQSHMRSFHKDDQDSLGWLKKDLAALGILPMLQQKGITIRQLLSEQLGLFLDRVVEIQVKRSASQDPANPFVNVYINRVLDGVAIPEELRTAPAGNSGGNAPAAAASSPAGGIVW